MTELAIIFMGIKGVLVGLLEWLKALGAAGLFGISLIDSVGVPLPGGPDAVMIWLSANSPGLMPFYALAATAGSAIGCTGLYVVARSAGVAALKRVAAQKRARIENLLGRYDLIAIMIPAVLPPPFPFKPFVLCAGVFKLKTWRFITAIFIGRAIRFLVEGWLAIRFGEDAGRIIKQHGWKLLVATAVIVVIAVLVKRTLSRRAANLDQLAEARKPELDSTR
ncbi:MAG TPA: VTT domain-containing protein [Blastocatellia bacterium]|nr:VTT domain-containing protein [Blastocatellia bacterium]